MSKDDLTALFSTLNDGKFKTILDIGSRSGCVLFAAALMTKAETIIGIEIDENWAKLSKKINRKFEFQSLFHLFVSTLNLYYRQG